MTVRNCWFLKESFASFLSGLQYFTFAYIFSIYQIEQPMATEDFLLLLSGPYIVKKKEARYLTTAAPKKGGSILQNDLEFRITSHMHSLSEGERSGINDLPGLQKDKVLLMNRYFTTWGSIYRWTFTSSRNLSPSFYINTAMSGRPLQSLSHHLLLSLVALPVTKKWF